MRWSERLFLAVSPLPPLAWTAASEYLDSLEGWGAWAAGPALLGPVILASLILGLFGVLLSLRARRSGSGLLRLAVATALAGSVSLVVGVRQIYAIATTDRRQFDPQPYLDAARQAERSGQRFRESARIGQISSRLSCQAARARISPEYGPAYERAHFLVPLQISAPGRYRLRLRYSSDLNPKRRELETEQVLVLDQGDHEIGLDYAFGRTWGYFVEAPASTLEIRLDRHVSLRDIHGEAASVLDENIDHKAFRNVILETRRLHRLANVYTDTVDYLVCPDQPTGPPNSPDGPQ